MKKKKEKEYFTINNYTMEIIHKRRIEEPATLTRYGYYKLLSSCYAKPSYYKQNIYRLLIHNLVNNNDDYKELIDFGVASYNSNIFTFNVDYIDNNNIYKVIHITPTHNYITIYDL